MVLFKKISISKGLPLVPFKFSITTTVSTRAACLLNMKLKKWNRNDFNFFSSFRRDDEEEAIEFYLRLCFDVLFEVFRFGCRRKLTKLERVGHRFHWLIEKYFPDGPFLRLDLELIPRFVSIFLSIHRCNHHKKSRKLKIGL